MQSRTSPKNTGSEIDFDAPLSPEADAFLARAFEQFEIKMERMECDWQVGAETEWGFDQGTGILRVKLPDGRKWEATGQMLGSFAPKENTWQWAWSNPNCIEAMSRDSLIVKVLGERFDIIYLQKPVIPVPERDFISYICAIAAEATNSQGVFEAIVEGPMGLFILMKEIRWIR